MTLRSSPTPSIDTDTILIASLVCILMLLGFIRSSDEFLHWFIMPITFSGILMAIDAVNWFRGRINLFDPVGILGLVGVHFFFLVPLLHIHWDIWQAGINPPADWRTWLGIMAILNSIGLLIYRYCRNPDLLLGQNPLKSSLGEQNSGGKSWRIDQRRFPLLLGLALVLSALLQLWVYQRFGGILAYIATATSDRDTTREAFMNMGLAFTFSESFPILAMMGFAVAAQRHKKLQTVPVLILVVVLFLILQLFFGGLRGSRSNTLWALFGAVGMIHLWIRPIAKRALVLGLIFLIGFMYVYGFFKSGGIEGLQQALEGEAGRAAMEERSGRTWEVVLTQDLGRSDIQAFLLYQIVRPDTDYEYAWGRTYGAALAILVPRSIWLDRPPGKTKEGTEAKMGAGYYVPGVWEASNVYGLAGEALLNFGPIAIPLSFIIFGLVVGQVRRALLTWQPFDTRTLMLPLLVNFCFVVLVGDLDNILFFIIKNGTFPFTVILFGSKVHYSPYPSLSQQPRKNWRC